jgi:thiol-disulfide isomerase/thioredoxin
MRIGVAILLNLLAMASIAIADETLPELKAGDQTYTHVTIFKISATDIYFTSDKGMANAKLKDLTPELQKHFHFNSTNAVAIEQKQKAANVQYFQNVSHPSASAGQSSQDGSKVETGTGKKIWASSFLNQPPPPLMVEKWLTPPPDTHGKFVLIDFWATWCGPCRAAIPELNAIHRDFGDKLVVIGISDESEMDVRRLADPKLEYSVAIDTQARTKTAVGVTGIPHVLIIDPKGIVRWEGFPLLQGHELNEKVVADIISQYSN